MYFKNRGLAMNIRIVVADERQANFFDASRPDAALTLSHTIYNPAGGMQDIDLETDRAGRRYGGTSGVSHGSVQAGHHHGVDGERSTAQHDLNLFAKTVAERIDDDRIAHAFDRLVIMASPKVLGLIRQSLSSQAQGMLASEIPKDILHHGPNAIMGAVPREVFRELG
jgi:protein required for attachment to host cells